MPIIAGEAKMLGSPAHIRASGERYPERPISIDLDKRIKEVKYTSVDLKRKFGISFAEGWTKWIDKSYPKFYSFWGCRLGERNKLSSLIEKFSGVIEYNNGCGVFIYKDRNYQKLIDEHLDAFSIDKVIDSIRNEVEKGHRPLSQGIAKSFKGYGNHIHNLCLSGFDYYLAVNFHSPVFFIMS